MSQFRSALRTAANGTTALTRFGLLAAARAAGRVWPLNQVATANARAAAEEAASDAADRERAYREATALATEAGHRT